MLPNLFSDPIILLSGALTGLIFGFLLQKGKASQFSTIVGQFLFKEFTLLKIMLTAIIVGSIGIYALIAVDLPVTLHIKEGTFFAISLGGFIFGIGMAILGYCPGTAVAAAGQGSHDAWWGILGMIFGTALYAEIYPWLKNNIHAMGKTIKTTLPEQFGISPWVIIAILATIVFIVIPIIKNLYKN